MVADRELEIDKESKMEGGKRRKKGMKTRGNDDRKERKKERRKDGKIRKGRKE